MNDIELYEYIKNRKYHCHLCNDLKTKVIEEGLTAIDEYEGFICGGIEDMQIRRWEENKNDETVYSEI